MHAGLRIHFTYYICLYAVRIQERVRIVLYIYIYIALLAVHANQKRFQHERLREYV